MKPHRRGTSGYILLEVLVTIVILAIGLLGLAGFQARATVAESEGYQRAQALILAQDMVDRIYANRINAATYVQNDIGVPATVTDCTALTGKDKDVCEWGNLLIGASEAVGTVNVGTLLGGRGCVTAGGANEYFVTVAWQGLVTTATPGNAGAAACGLNQYKDQSGATNDAIRRVVAMRVVISTLSTP
ncbi:MAG TPA: type IV pilus modification protein PilV [Casimicrobiaceae bacterium]|jgi:type IV pilus assembly protein PilV